MDNQDPMAEGKSQLFFCSICDSPMSSEAIENEWTTCSQACDRLAAMMRSIEGLTDAYFRGFVKQDHNATD